MAKDSKNLARSVPVVFILLSMLLFSCMFSFCGLRDCRASSCGLGSCLRLLLESRRSESAHLTKALVKVVEVLRQAFLNHALKVRPKADKARKFRFQLCADVDNPGRLGDLDNEILATSGGFAFNRNLRGTGAFGHN